MMLCQSREIARHQTTLRWKEWIPLLSQQLRLRSLIQIIAYNIESADKNVHHKAESSIRDCSNNCAAVIKSVAVKGKTLFYYTLHLTTMSAPFYTSEKLENENAKWIEIEISSLMDQLNCAVSGIVVRLWSHRAGGQDQVITVWGVYFSGLVYLGPMPCADPTMLGVNTIVFHMQGGYFTAAQCIKQSPSKIRSTRILLRSIEVKPSYNVNSLLRLQTKQQAINKHMLAAQDLRQKISLGGLVSKSKENAVLRRLLNDSRPKAPQRKEIIKARKYVELAKFQVKMLLTERSRKEAQLQNLMKLRDCINEDNLERGSEMMNKYQTLHKDIEHLKEWRKTYVDMREAFLHTNAQLSFRRKQLISELSLIYPIAQFNGKFSIGGIHLPNSEDFTGNEDIMISVALGFVAHLVQMVSVFLQVPLRYPIHYFSSRSKIIDNVAEKIPDKDREFPLFSRGKDKLQFNYGVYLLNKNIAQLRWLCGLPTQDLRATLPNITALLHLRPGSNGLDSSHHSVSGSSVDLRSSSQNISPVGSFQASSVIRRHLLRSPSGPSLYFERGHRISKSMGSSELKFPLKTVDDEVLSLHKVNDKKGSFDVGNQPANSLSYSLDKGLDEYEEMKKAEHVSKPTSKLGAIHGQVNRLGTGHMGSEPILSPEGKGQLNSPQPPHYQIESSPPKSNEAQKQFLQRWHAGGGLGQICSDDDFEVSHRHPEKLENISHEKDVSSFSLVMSSASKNMGIDEYVKQGTQLSECQETAADETHKSGEFNLGISSKEVSDDLQSKKPAELCVELSSQNSRSATTSETDSFSVNLDEAIDDSIYQVSSRSDLDSYKAKYSDENIIPCDSYSLSNNPSTTTTQVPNTQREEGFNRILDDMSDDIVFARVASRTEALANQTSSFNLVRTKRGSSLDEGTS